MHDATCASPPTLELQLNTTVRALDVSGALTVVHADAAFLVVDKPAYLTVENTVSNKDSVRSRLEAAGHARLHLAHRLDWETSGLLVVALDAAAASSLS